MLGLDIFFTKNLLIDFSLVKIALIDPIKVTKSLIVYVNEFHVIDISL